MAAQNPFPHLRREVADSKAMDWGRALPAVVRLLADRRADVALPICPVLRSGESWDRTFSSALAYWTALDHVLRFQLGWTFPAQGLARWLDEGTPDDARPLALIRHVWLGDGHLSRYLAWRLEKTVDHPPSAGADGLGAISYKGGKGGQPIGPWQLHLEDDGHVLSPQQSAPPKLAWLSPFSAPVTGKTPPLLGQAEPVLLFRGSLESGWYGALKQAPTHTVRVVSEQHGLIGHYTRSASTDRWHTVPEEIHTWGVRPN